MNADNLEHRRFNQSFQSERPTPRQKSSRLSPLGAQATLLRCLRGADSLLRAISMQRLEQAPPPPHDRRREHVFKGRVRPHPSLNQPLTVAAARLGFALSGQICFSSFRALSCNRPSRSSDWSLR